jgi:hypothetical protein
MYGNRPTAIYARLPIFGSFFLPDMRIRLKISKKVEKNVNKNFMKEPFHLISI